MYYKKKNHRFLICNNIICLRYLINKLLLYYCTKKYSKCQTILF